ncbi:hypothetical protein K502DRAFT_346024 [Neoconidiobolus thromboides FSU 785]|nr:hypothetical protein K502DRAFT_346024 [Neoconidiobolus thromboides FSU 785]
MKSNSKTKIRSRVDIFKLKLDRVGSLLNNAFNQLDSHSNLKVKQIAYDYLKWAQKELEALNRDSNYTENNKIFKKISQFEAILDRNSKVNAASSLSVDETVYVNIGSMKVYQTYGEFIENGTVFFKKVMDPSKLWVEELDLKRILENKEPNILSYTLIALLSRFTLPRNSMNYQQIYGKALQGVKATLPQAYSNPSYNHVVALGLLSFIGLYRLNFSFAKRYFLDAVRMAQCLGYNISNSLFDEIDATDVRYNDLLKGRKIWKTLYLTYLVLSSCISNMPFIKFEVKDPLHHFKQNQNNYNANKVLCSEISKESRYLCVRNFIEVNIKIATHIQKVKESYETNKDYSKIPPNDLLLPQKEFINCLTILINLIQDRKLAKDESEYSKGELDERVDDDGFNFERYIKILIQHTIVTLYYPSVMVYPQPVPFTSPELKLLFNHANQVITFYLNKGLDKKFDRETFTRMYHINPKHRFQAIIIPFYYQICYCFFALINLLHQPSVLDPEDIYMIDESETKCLLFVKELSIISKSGNVKQAKNSINALNQIKYCIHQFQLSEDLTQKIHAYLN